MNVKQSGAPAAEKKTRAKKSARKRLPEWLRKAAPCGAGDEVAKLLSGLNLNTVCASAHCPNRLECYGRGRATFLIMGPNCTRQCRFCAVSKKDPVPLDPDEPQRVATAVAKLKLRHAVITSVTRDDLPDGGAQHFVAVIEAIRAAHACTVEVLTPDFQGNKDAILAVAASAPDIYNHNVETVPRLYPVARPQADYFQSVDFLRLISKTCPQIPLKSGVMVGMGEEREELCAVFADLAEAGCRILTIGQYLAPSKEHLPVERFVPPEEFDELAGLARAAGLEYVASAPFVRSSYNAEEVFAAFGNKAGGEC